VLLLRKGVKPKNVESKRNKNPNKYLDDAKILEDGYKESIVTKDGLHNRYAYYCANSYMDAGKREEAITWYKRTLTLQGWFDERYNSCLKCLIVIK
jgi:tetratricopeptide (TPR) repeat protein